MIISLIQGKSYAFDFEKNFNSMCEFIKISHKLNSNVVVFPFYFLTGYNDTDIYSYNNVRQKFDIYLKKILEYSKNFKDLRIIFGLYKYIYTVVNGNIESSSDNKSLFCKINDKEFFLFLNNDDLLNNKDEVKNKKSISIKLLQESYSYYKEINLKKFISNIKKNISNLYIETNLIGVFDQNIFDGENIIYDSEKEKIYISPYLEDGITLLNLSDYNYSFYSLVNKNNFNLNTYDFSQYGKEFNFIDLNESSLKKLHDILIFGTKEYVNIAGFDKVCLGISGGIDSATVAYIASKAFGAENVYMYTLPSEFSTKGSYEDSYNLAKNLNIRNIEKIEIKNIYQAYLNELNPYFLNKPFDITEENLQARIRANILMAFSNKFGFFMLNTSNKSEVATGYGTMYGDVTGGLSVLGDVYKTLIYKLADFINKEDEIIPENIIKKAPSAELRVGQKDQDTLPPYELLDNIVYYFLEEGLDGEEIYYKIKDKFEEDRDKNIKETIRYTIKLIAKNEYKRKQAPPLLKVSKKSFGFDRKVPINSFYLKLFENF